MTPDMHFAGVYWAWPMALLAWPLPVLAMWLLPRYKSSGARALLVDDPGVWSSRSGGAQVTWLQQLLLALMWTALVLAVARPQTFSESISLPDSGRDLMMAVDISGSMREQDIALNNRPVTRMAVVKAVGEDFIARRAGDRVGLILFGSQAYVQTPLTEDHETVQYFLRDAAIGLAGRSTAIGDAIGLAVKRLRERKADTRVLVLLTDGENTAGVQPLEAAQLAADNNVRIYTIGIGAGGSASLGFGLRRQELDERSLTAVAELTGGKYFRARNANELETIYADIDALEPTEELNEGFRPRHERFVWPLAMSLLLSMLWGFTRLNRGLAGGLSE